MRDGEVGEERNGISGGVGVGREVGGVWCVLVSFGGVVVVFTRRRRVVGLGAAFYHSISVVGLMSIRSLSCYAIFISDRVIRCGIGLGALAVSRRRILSVRNRFRY